MKKAGFRRIWGALVAVALGYSSLVFAGDAFLIWNINTDPVAGYKVYYGTQSSNYSTVIDVGTHTFYRVTGLNVGKYYFAVSAYDGSGRESARSSEVSKKITTAVNTFAPVINAVGGSNINANGAIISWTTDVPSDTQVEYGTTTAYGNLTPLNPNLTSAHWTQLTGLIPGTLYHYRVRSGDANGMLAASDDFAFTTSAIINKVCPLPYLFCFNAKITGFRAMTPSSFGVGSLSVVYGDVLATTISSVVALANFGYTQNGALVTEVGIPGASPVSTARLFVDFASGTDSGVALVNLNDTPLTIQGDLRSSDGNLFATSHLQLGPKSHTALFVSQWFQNLPATFLGTLTLSSTGQFVAVNLHSALNGHGETIFSALPVADLNNPSTAAELIFSQIVGGSGGTTQILLMNPSGTTAISGTVSLFDDNGNPLSLDFGPGVGLSNSLFYSIPPNGMVKFSTIGNGPLVGGYAVVIPGAGPLPVASAVFSINSSFGLASQADVLNAPETLSSMFFIEKDLVPLNRNTGVAIVNHNNVPALISLALNGFDGSIQVKNVTMPPNGRLVQFINQLFPDVSPQFQGVLTLASNAPLATLTLRLTVNQRGENIYSVLPGVDLNQVLSGSFFIPQVVDGGGYQTQLILLNASNLTGLIQLGFFTDNGTNVALPMQ